MCIQQARAVGAAFTSKVGVHPPIARLRQGSGMGSGFACSAFAAGGYELKKTRVNPE